MPVSLSKVLISFSFLIDLKEMPIDEYKRTVVAREQSTQIGNPARMICKMLCFDHVAAYFLSKRFYILETCVIFLRSCFSRSFHGYGALPAFGLIHRSKSETTGPAE